MKILKTIELLSPWVIIGVIAVYRGIEYYGKMAFHVWVLITIISVLAISSWAREMQKG